MEKERLCQHLEDIVRQLGISLRYESLHQSGYSAKGGLCSINGKRHLIIEKTKKTPEKIKQLIQCLKEMDLEGVYIKPAVRDLLNIPRPETERSGQRMGQEKEDDTQAD
jgi:hypothetical protein